MKKNVLRRAVTAVLAIVLALSLSVTAFASEGFVFPSEYWPLQAAWSEARKAQDVEKTITVASQTYDLMRPLGLGQTVCDVLEPICGVAGWLCELKGDLAGELLWLTRHREILEWQGNSLVYIDAKIAAIEAANSPAIYALTDAAGTSYSGSGAKTTGTLYGSAVDSYQSGGESATLMYVSFNDGKTMEYWVNYYRNNFSHFKSAITNGGVVEVAWNVSPSSTAGVEAALSADSYINASLKTLGSLNCTVLLRFGAEMNNWSKGCDEEVFKQAFRKIADAAHKYSNIKMVFSPNDLTSPGIGFEKYYPGDSYVDWIGMSSYHNSNYTSLTGKKSSVPDYTFSYSYNHSYDNAFWNEGLYEDPLQAIKPIVEFAQAHGKPVMISECGFGYQTPSGTNQTDYAAKMVNWFYSYVNMVYPQVKAVFYFNTDPGSNYKYALANNATVRAAYEGAVASNGGYLTGSSSAGTWKKLSEAGQQTGTVRLATYAPLPGKESATVKYYVDGILTATVTQAPYYYDLNTDVLSSGNHTVRAVVTSGQFTVTAQSTIKVNNPNLVFKDVFINSWFADSVAYVAKNGIMNGEDVGVFNPDGPTVRGAVVTILARIDGVNTEGGTTWFQKGLDWAASRNVWTKGGPDDKATRQEIVYMLWAYAGRPSSKETLSEFPDVDKVTGEYKNAMAWAVEVGIVRGTEKGLEPLLVLDRATLATLVARYCQTILGKA